MEVAKGLEVKYEGGKIKLEYALKEAFGPKLAELKAKVASGEVDLIPGTDLEKPVVLQILEGVERELSQ